MISGPPWPIFGRQGHHSDGYISGVLPLNMHSVLKLVEYIHTISEYLGGLRREEAVWPLLNNNDPLHPAVCNSYFGPIFFRVTNGTMFSKYNGCRLKGRLISLILLNFFSHFSTSLNIISPENCSETLGRISYGPDGSLDAYAYNYTDITFQISYTCLPNISYKSVAYPVTTIVLSMLMVFYCVLYWIHKTF